MGIFAVYMERGGYGVTRTQFAANMHAARKNPYLAADINPLLSLDYECGYVTPLKTKQSESLDPGNHALEKLGPLASC